MPDYDQDLHGDKYDYNPQAIESPVDWVAEDLSRRTKIQNPDDVVGLCTECKTTHEPAMMEKNIFAREGVPPSCRYCGGVVTIAFREIVEATKERLDGARGIDRS